MALPLRFAGALPIFAGVNKTEQKSKNEIAQEVKRR